MSYKPLVPARLAFNAAGIPYSPAFDDIYHSASGGLAQARHVFLAGNELPRAWRGRKQFVILETGFGLGLNFLVTWQAWRGDPQRCERLHFVSVEKHPFARADLIQLHRQWPELDNFAQELQNQWPVLTSGMHRLLLDHGRVTLTLLFGDATTEMRKLAVQADALYLDGFAPTKNPELWDQPFLKGLTRLCKPGATLATWSVSSSVREALSGQRWTLEKRAGFGSKRGMLCGKLFGQARTTPQVKDAKHAIVIGAGIAGSAIAERLAARQWRVEVLERYPADAGATYATLAGLMHPMLAKDDNLAARLARAGYLYALRLLEQLDGENLGLRLNRCGIFQLARDAAQEAEQHQTTDTLGFPDDYVTFVARAEAERRIGHAVMAGGWYYPAGISLNPPSLCRALLSRHPLTVQAGSEVASLRYADGNWHALDAAGKTLASAPVLIVANAYDAMRLVPQCNLPLTRIRGQTSLLPPGTLPFLRHALCGNGYATPDTLGVHCVGATYDLDDDDFAPRADGHRFNLDRLAELLPGDDLAQRFDPAQMDGRVGFRTMAIDRMPIVGALPDATQPLKPGARLRDVPRLSGLHALLALGSHGLARGLLAAEQLAAQLNREPQPLERDLGSAIDPARFLLRKQRRSLGEAAKTNFRQGELL